VLLCLLLPVCLSSMSWSRTCEFIHTLGKNQFSLLPLMDYHAFWLSIFLPFKSYSSSCNNECVVLIKED
jgi:hypothetical protein